MNKKSKETTIEAKIINDYLNHLGYSEDSKEVYLTLVRNGPSTLLNISRESGIERTRLYRLTDKLIKDGIVDEVPAYKRKTLKAVDLSAIELMVKEKESQAKVLLENFNVFSEAVKNYNSSYLPKVNVVYYRGSEGIKQMVWHSLSCEGLYRTYSYRFWNDIMGDKFTLNINRIMLEKKMKVHDLYSDQYIKYKEKWMREKGKKPGGDWSFWDARYISERIVKIDQNIDIYNDIVAYSYWDEDDIFGVEIQNKRVADMQKQIHDVLWKMGKKLGHFDWANPVWRKNKKYKLW